MTLWGGSTPELMRRFNDSFRFDVRLYAADITGSVAYAAALTRAGLLSEEERTTIVAGLEQVRTEFEGGTFEAHPTDEDIHTAVERRLTELVGPLAGKLHTGRSRNDQVALDLRLWLIDAYDRLHAELKALQTALTDKAAAHLEPVVIMPGYTHLQPAQPVLFSHWLLSFGWMLDRDRDRLIQAAERTAVSPLGAGALSGTPFPIDRVALAADLGLRAVTPNSMDAVADRDFVAEALFVFAMLGVHLSRLAEDLIIYASHGFVTVDAQYATGSSLMPQKRNPDSLELARGKSARLLGHLVTLLTLLKGLPSTYNKDLQEDKEPLFDAVDTLAVLLPVVRGVVETLHLHPERMRAAISEGMLATDLSDYLVRRGMPFREAHHVVRDLVLLAEQRGVALSALPMEDYTARSALFEADVREVFDVEQAVARRGAVGGTAPDAVREQIAALRQRLS